MKLLIDTFIAVSDPTVDDDNQSDSDEYEYEVVEEIEEVDVDTDELAHTECDVNTKSHSKHLIISEGEPIHVFFALQSRTNAQLRTVILWIFSRNNYVTWQQQQRKFQAATRDAHRQNGRIN